MVGIRTASHAFQAADNEKLDRVVMGGNYTGHFGSDPVVVAVVESEAKHPVLEGVGAITSGKLYKAGPLAESSVLLQTGAIKSKNVEQSVTWVNEYNGARTFYTSLGVPTDFEDDDFKRLIVNAIFWTLEKQRKDFLAK